MLSRINRLILIFLWFLLAFILVLPFSSPVRAETVTLTWDYGTTTGITGFKLYCTPTNGTWPGTPTATIPVASPKQANFTFTGRQWCTVRAYDATGESSNSNVLALLEGPTGLRVASLSVQFNPTREKVTIKAVITDVLTGEVLSEVSSDISPGG